jgi:hypothetical protein
LSEFFDPGMDRLPIIGMVEEIQGRTFGECQKSIDFYLAGHLKSNSALEDTITVMEYYYEEFKPQLEDSLQVLNIGNTLDLSLRKLIQIGIESKLVIGEKVNSLVD